MKHHSITLLVTTSALIALGPLAWAQTAPVTSSATSVPADNSRNNTTDPTDRMSTADMQKNDRSDLDLSKRIRERLTADKSLSTSAHNAKIIAVNGQVTLNGVVRSQQEKTSVEMKAVEIAGRDRVVNDLKIIHSR